MDNFPYFSIKTYIVNLWGLIKIAGEAILMSTHNIFFYGELTKIVLQLSSNIHRICSTV